jgi:hypothetical protein
MLPDAATLPEASTLKTLEELACRSSRLPDGVPLVLLARIKAWPEVGLELAAMERVELVPPVLVSDSTPEAPLLVLVKAYRLPRTEAEEVSELFLLSLLATEAEEA